MNNALLACLFLFLVPAHCLAAPAPPPPKDYPIRAIPFTEVRVTDGFWSPRLETNRVITLPYAFKKCEETGRIDNFAKAGKLMTGGFQGIFFNDSDVFKVIEGAAYSLAIHPDPTFESYVDGVIDKIASAQEPDGYLYTARTLCGADYMPPGGKERWSDIGSGHELYNLGHLYEAAVAYDQATGKRRLLDIALKSAELVCRTFGPGLRTDPPGHQQIEIGLARLYRVTGDEKYLRQAKFFLDSRGRLGSRKQLYGEYSQDHQPVVEQEEAVGHAVRAAYMYTGMADVAALTGDPSYVEAIHRIWKDVMNRKLYLTGGLGAAGGHEGFGAEYFLPNRTAYCETCASVASAMWNHRMFLGTGEGRFMDAAEQVIYNAFLSGISMNGDSFFYPNPLESFRGERRQPWFPCACCPANVVRFVPSIPGYAYAQRDDTVFVNLFLGSDTAFALAGQTIRLHQETGYPWVGRTTLTLASESPADFTLAIRIPGWLRNQPAASDLYRFQDGKTTRPTLRINGRKASLSVEQGYARLRRTWKSGDRVELELPMLPRRVLASEKVAADLGRVAVQRGPIVFCSEGLDQAEPRVPYLFLPDTAKLSASYRPDLLNGVVVVSTSARVVERQADGALKLGPAQDLSLIPYYAQAHRERTPMTVWLARDLRYARALPAPTLALRSKVSVSRGTGVEALNDQLEAASSDDHANPFFHWWPRERDVEWVEYQFPESTRVSAVDVYWFDDHGGCRLPKTWRLLARSEPNGEWKEVAQPSAYGVRADGFNSCTFTPTEADALRLEVTLPPDAAAGIHEWVVR